MRLPTGERSNVVRNRRCDACCDVAPSKMSVMSLKIVVAPLDDAVVIVGGVGVDAEPDECAVGLADPHRLVVHVDPLIQRDLRRLGLDRPG